MKKVQLYCITHRPYGGLPDNSVTKPLLVGMDNANIDLKIRDYYPEFSKMNLYWNELEAIYYIWKNVDTPIKGQYQYSCRPILGAKTINKYLKTNDFLVHIDLVKNLRKQFEQYHGSELFDLLIDVVRELHGDEISNDVIEKFSNSTILISRNIFICTKEKYDEYCEFLFPIIFRITERLGFNSMADIEDYLRKRGCPENMLRYQSRIAGFLAERIFTLYLVWKQATVFLPEYKRFNKVI